jgi:hypothetical protein
MLAHPLIGQWGRVRDLERGLFESGAEHLPQFAGRLDDLATESR